MKKFTISFMAVCLCASISVFSVGNLVHYYTSDDRNDDLRIYNDVLTETEILTLYNYVPEFPPARNYNFNGNISREVLDNYLSRAITLSDHAFRGYGDRGLDRQLVQNTGAKFIGRVTFIWANDQLNNGIEGHFSQSATALNELKAMDSNLLVQAALFEAVGTDVTNIPIPAWVFQTFGLPVESRSFVYNDMLFPNGRGVNHWGLGRSIPDIRQLETRFWYYYLAKRYIDLGYEAFHLGQIKETGYYDTDYANWWDLCNKIRRYAAANALRKYVLLDAHCKGIKSDSGNLLLDFDSYPQRPNDVEPPENAVLEMGRSIYGSTLGGMHPSGWSCTHSPYIVEFDNFGLSSHPGTPNQEPYVWGYDEITWFAKQPDQYRNNYLIYAWNWIRQYATNGWLQMPGTRPLAMEVNSSRTYYANPPSLHRPNGFNQEATIAAIWNTSNIITYHIYNFENQNTDDSDGSLNGFPNDITYTTNSKVGNYAAVFNGSSSYIQFPETDFGIYFSVAAWVYPEEPNNICTIINNRLAGNAENGFDFYVNNPWVANANGSLFFETGNDTDAGNASVSGDLVPTNEWHHVAAVVNKAIAKINLYIDGELMLEQANIRNDFNAISVWRFGSSINGENYFKGKMDDIHVTSNLLTTAEIKILAGVPEPSVFFLLYTISFLFYQRHKTYIL